MINKFKRFCVTIILAVTLVAILPQMTQAAPEEISTDSIHLLQEGDTAIYEAYCEDEIPLYEAPAGSYQLTVYDSIKNGVANLQTEIDISVFNLTPDQLKPVFSKVRKNTPEFFYLESDYKYYYKEQLGVRYVTRLVPYYDNIATIEERRTIYKQEMNKILQMVDSSWSDLEKIVFLHDYLAQNYEYDSSYTIYDAYNFLTEKTGVCMAYSLVYKGLLEQLGIECTTAISESMNHMWNLVKVNDKWYHVDVTWDDPVDDDLGLANHNYLLLSDAEISSSEKNHYGWVTDYSCTDNTYKDYFWEASRSPFQYYDGRWYYVSFDSNSKKAYLYTYDFTGNSSNALTEIGRWYIDGSLYYLNAYSGLDVYDGKLYLNNGNEILSYNADTKTINTEYTPAETGLIFGMRIDGNTLYYTKAASASDKPTTYSYKLKTTIQFGDVDADGNINAGDALLVLKHAVKLITLGTSQSLRADMNSDGFVTSQDALLILRTAANM